MRKDISETKELMVINTKKDNQKLHAFGNRIGVGVFSVLELWREYFKAHPEDNIFMSDRKNRQQCQQKQN